MAACCLCRVQACGWTTAGQADGALGAARDCFTCIVHCLYPQLRKFERQSANYSRRFPPTSIVKLLHRLVDFGLAREEHQDVTCRHV